MIRLHHCAETRSMRTLWQLNEIGCEFEIQRYEFGKALRSDEFKAINPVSRVPALEIDGEVLIETGAIAEILCEKFPEAGLGRPIGDPERNMFLQLIHFAETISQHCAILTQQHVMLYEDHMRSPILTQLEPKRLAKTIGFIEERMAGDFLLSDFSAADICVGQAIYMAQRFVRLDPFPRVAAWMVRMTERPAFRASLPLDGEPRLYNQSFFEPIPSEGA